tara:strand:+ start:6367 stop:7161 length:795 start_codon:yes stop_codon:yes gene_type:complete
MVVVNNSAITPDEAVRTGFFRRDLFGTPIFVASTHNKSLCSRATDLAYYFKENSDCTEGLVSEEWNKSGRSADKEDWDKYGVTSFYSRNLLREKPWQPIADELLQGCKGMLARDTLAAGPLGERNERYFDFIETMKISNMWTTIYPKDGFVPYHIHSNYRWSGVFYAKAEPGCGEIVFQDPSWATKTMTQGCNPDLNPYFTVYRVEPKSGELVLFPAWLPHKSEPNKSGEDRIIVSFNLYFEDEEIIYKRFNNNQETNEESFEK